MQPLPEIPEWTRCIPLNVYLFRCRIKMVVLKAALLLPPHEMLPLQTLQVAVGLLSYFISADIVAMSCHNVCSLLMTAVWQLTSIKRSGLGYQSMQWSAFEIRSGHPYTMCMYHISQKGLHICCILKNADFFLWCSSQKYGSLWTAACCLWQPDLTQNWCCEVHLKYILYPPFCRLIEATLRILVFF